ncbi:MAG: hypothetical protein JWM98_482 [Thermoleophilia bacterium]|nr:hypothetical protein [Thermoleophilia bacterium]
MERTFEELDTTRHASAPVTTPNRITGTTVHRQETRGVSRLDQGASIDWGAILASALVGLALTTMLVILGVSTGLIAGDKDTSSNDAMGILGSIGAWTVIAAIIGAFVGSVLGGRLARWLDRGKLAYHVAVSWAVGTLASLLLLAVIVIAFASSTTSAAATDVAAGTGANNGQAAAGSTGGAQGTTAGGGQGQGTDGATDPNPGDDNTAGKTTDKSSNAENTADALGGAGLALTLGMLLTLAASAAGWWIGSRKRLTDFEREDATPMTQVDETHRVVV